MKETKNKIGRPSLINEDVIVKAKEYLFSGYKEDDGVVPSIAGLACYLGIGRSTIYDYQKANPGSDFSDTLEAILALQEHKLVNNGLVGTFNATITKLMLANHGYSERVQQSNISSDDDFKDLGDFYADNEKGETKP